MLSCGNHHHTLATAQSLTRTEDNIFDKLGILAVDAHPVIAQRNFRT
jgi:arginase family enzyme